MSRGNGPENAGACRACVVVIGDRTFGVEVRVAREVLILGEPTRVPGAPPHILGVVNRRGTILPIVDLRPLLGYTSRPLGRGARALVVQAEAVSVGLLIDEVRGLEGFDAIMPLVGAAHDSHARFGLGLLERRAGEPPVLLLDIPRVLNALRVGHKAAQATPDTPRAAPPSSEAEHPSQRRDADGKGPIADAGGSRQATAHVKMGGTQ